MDCSSPMSASGAFSINPYLGPTEQISVLSDRSLIDGWRNEHANRSMALRLAAWNRPRLSAGTSGYSRRGLSLIKSKPSTGPGA